MAVRGGAHSMSGASSVDGGLVIGLSPMRKVSVDPVARQVRAGGGALSIDNLISTEVVLANGDILHASKDEHPYLFWALRGGGGNFGVVTEFEFALHEVGAVVDFGLFFWPLEEGAQMLR